MIIRFLEQKDLSQLVAFMNESWKIAYPDYYAQELSIINRLFDPLTVQKQLEDESLLYLGAFEENELIGFAKLGLGDHSSFLDKIYVHHLHQKQGIGKKLLLSCFNQAYVAGINNIGLEVADDNPHAIRFYEKYGFKCNPIKRLYPGVSKTCYYTYIMVCTNIRAILDSFSFNREDYKPMQLRHF